MQHSSSGDFDLDSKFHNAMHLYGVVALSYSRDSAWLVSDLWDDKHNGVDGGIRRNVEALEIYPYEQKGRWEKN